MINWYMLGSRNEIIESGIPQRYLDFLVEGRRVRIDISLSYSDGVTSVGINIVYDGYSLPTRLLGKGITYQLDDKYGAREDGDGLIYLGVKHAG